MTTPRACIIGAGSSGIAAAKGLLDTGIPFDLYEKSDRVGGLWVYENPSGTAAAYRNLHSNAPKSVMGYPSFPLPKELPAYPSHWDFARYFDAYARHHGVIDHIRFETGVAHVERRDDGVFEVELEDGTTHEYDCVLVANGHHWNPKWPDPMFPGEFDGTLMHSRDFRDAAFMAGKRVVVCGIGNSAVDIVTEASPLAEKAMLSVRRGAHIMPKFLFGQAPPKWAIDAASWKLGRVVLGAAVTALSGRAHDYGLPKPDHAYGDAHPTMSATLMDQLRLGMVTPKPPIAELMGDRVRFTDGTVEEVDIIVCATGYQITFPFFDEDYISAPDNRIDLYHRVVHPDRPGLFFVGLCQPLGAIQPIAELQGEWIGKLLARRCALPDPVTMRQSIAEDRTGLDRRFVSSTRHTIQVDHRRYMNALRKEMRAGEGRPVAGAHVVHANAGSLPLSGRAASGHA